MVCMEYREDNLTFPGENPLENGFETLFRTNKNSIHEINSNWESLL